MFHTNDLPAQDVARINAHKNLRLIAIRESAASPFIYVKQFFFGESPVTTSRRSEATAFDAASAERRAVGLRNLGYLVAVVL